MAEMKTLTVNGKTYTVADPDAAHIDDTVIGGSAWSGKNIIDRLCPAFTVSGAAVRCQPVEGYPLQVTTALPALEAGYTGITLRLLGKNLYNKDSYPLTQHYIGWESGSIFTSSNFFATGTYIPVPGLQGKTVTLNHCPNDKTPGTRAGMAFYDADQAYISGTNGATMTVPDNAAYMRFSVPNEYTADDIQLEVGSEITAYEPYRGGSTVDVDFGKTVYGGSFHWTSGVLTDENGAKTRLAPSTIPALPGTNTLYGSCGETTVTGRRDLIALLQELTGE